MLNKKEKVALSSVFASAVMTVGKFIVGIMSGSMGIISEAAHSALDLGAAGLTLFAVKVSDKPADDKHPYGHGKVESISALIETGLLFLTSAWIIYEAIHRIINKNTEIEITWYAFAVIIVSIIYQLYCLYNLFIVFFIFFCLSFVIISEKCNKLHFPFCSLVQG